MQFSLKCVNFDSFDFRQITLPRLDCKTKKLVKSCVVYSSIKAYCWLLIYI